MNVLLLGDPCSVWEKEFVQYVLLPMGAEVYLQDNLGSTGLFASFYSQTGVTVIPYATPPAMIQRIPKLRVAAAIYLQSKRLRRYSPFDLIINMFANPAGLSGALLYKSSGTRVISYFCGSDVIRATSLTCKRLKHMLKRTDGIVLASEAVNDAFVRKIGRLPAVPRQIIHFGLSAFDEITNALATDGKAGCKADLALDPTKKTVCIGYNASEAQNHAQIISQLHQLPKATLERITLILPMTYGGTEEYIAGVEQAVTRLGCDYRLIRVYMDKAQMARLWGATDIFVNAQTTDGLSGSVIEALFAGATLINASWLQYREYDQWGIAYETFSCWEQLPSLLQKALKQNETADHNNQHILYEHMSWNRSSASWKALINGSGALDEPYGK